MVEVFKTDVAHPTQAAVMLELLSWHYPGCRISFDLDDCDRILRIEGDAVKPERVAALLNSNGHHCQVLF